METDKSIQYLVGDDGAVDDGDGDGDGVNVGVGDVIYNLSSQFL